MQTNLFSIQRSHYEPVIPPDLKQIETLKIRPHTQSKVSDAIGQIFPHLSQTPRIEFESGLSVDHPTQKVGVFFSGGQASGGHNVVIGLFDALRALNPNNQLIGFLSGPDGLLSNQFIPLTADALAPYRHTGGFDLLGSGRTKIETPEHFQKAYDTIKAHNLTGLVVIGGDDSNTNAAFLAEFLKTQGSKTTVVGIPKTIDGDLKGHGIDLSFGFHTASSVYAETISSIERDALSAKKYTHFIKLMGRSASHITLECALKTHPNVALIAEEVSAKGQSLDFIVSHLAHVIEKRAEAGKNYGVILLPEGLIEFIPEIQALIKDLNRKELSSTSEKLLKKLPQTIALQLQEERDPHGNVQVSKIATDQLLIELITERLKNSPSFKGKFSPVGHFLGYEGRCAFPTNFDATYTLCLGKVAAVLIDQGFSGYMAQLNHLVKSSDQWAITAEPLIHKMQFEERKGKMKPVIAKTLVDLKAEPFKYFASFRDTWAYEDDYQFIPPIQYFGPSVFTDERPLTLQLEHPTVI